MAPNEHYARLCGWKTKRFNASGTFALPRHPVAQHKQGTQNNIIYNMMAKPIKSQDGII